MFGIGYFSPLTSKLYIQTTLFLAWIRTTVSYVVLAFPPLLPSHNYIQSQFLQKSDGFLSVQILSFITFLTNTFSFHQNNIQNLFYGLQGPIWSGSTSSFWPHLVLLSLVYGCPSYTGLLWHFFKMSDAYFRAFAHAIPLPETSLQIAA